MNIAVIYQGKFPPEKGASGSDRRVRDITRGLAQDNNVFMLVPFWNRSTKINEDQSEFIIHYLGSEKWNRLSSRMSFWKSIKEFGTDNSIDTFLFYNTTFDGIPTARYLKKRGFKVLYEICDLPSSNIKGLKRNLNELSEKYMPKSTNLNIVISEYLEEKVKEVAPSTPALRIPILVDSDTFRYQENMALDFRSKYGIGEVDVLIAYAGGTWKQEGLKYLVDGFDLALKENNKLKLAIAGRLIKKSDDHDDVEALINEKNLSNNIIALGWVTTEEIVELYSAADILALPQIDNEFNIAGLPTKLAEYSAMKKPILATNVGDVGSYFSQGENASICEANSAESIKDHLLELASDSNLRNKIAEGAYQVSQNYFNYKVAGKRMLDAIKIL